MKCIYILLLLISILGCEGNKTVSESETDSALHEKREAPFEDQKKVERKNSSEKNVYANERFRGVTVEKVGVHKYLVQGEGQIFEANFGWVVEDGHNELKKGYEMTEEGAPAWGEFSFTITVEKERANSTLTLILFETSPKDGNRQHQLPVVLD